jgi:hypothetical protein
MPSIELLNQETMYDAIQEVFRSTKLMDEASKRIIITLHRISHRSLARNTVTAVDMSGAALYATRREFSAH